MFSSQPKLSVAIKAIFVQLELVICFAFGLPDLAYATCSLPDTIKTDTTISGTCALVKDLFINPGVTLTIIPPCTLFMTARSDAKNLGSDPSRIEILVKGGLRVSGNSGPNGMVVFRSDSGRAGDWYGIRSVDSSAKVFVGYATLSGWRNSSIVFFDQRSSMLDSVQLIRKVEKSRHSKYF
ncbi:MAG TPA: hypothetical protein VNL73_07735 [Verrucomicrobiae bacterium]|nr:hypothetical protein [Verrucomicrobiae bacterium]